MSEQCHRIEDFGILAELTPGDPRLAHVAACPACRSRLAIYRRFMAGNPDHADAAREKELAAFLQREILGQKQERRPAPLPWWRGLVNSRRLAPLLATAALLVLFVSFQQYRQASRPGEDSVVRSQAAVAPEMQLAATATADGGMRFSWQTPAEKGEYRVVLYAADLQEVARFDAGTATALELDAEQWAGVRRTSGPLIWRVETLRSGDLRGSSQPAVIPAEGS